MRRGRALSAAERALWSKVAADVSPLHEGAETGRNDRHPSECGVSHGAGVQPSARAEAITRGQGASQGTAARKLKPKARTDLFAAGDPKLDRHAARTRIPIDARLDLHGMTQEAARSALRGFVERARANGARCVLVITGKGGVAGRGVLRSRLGDWLHEAPLRDHLVRVAPAHARHGGGGAFYLFLRASTAPGRGRP